MASVYKLEELELFQPKINLSVIKWVAYLGLKNVIRLNRVDKTYDKMT